MTKRKRVRGENSKTKYTCFYLYCLQNILRRKIKAASLRWIDVIRIDQKGDAHVLCYNQPSRSYQGSNLGYGKEDCSANETSFKIPCDNHYTIQPTVFRFAADCLRMVQWQRTFTQGSCTATRRFARLSSTTTTTGLSQTRSRICLMFPPRNDRAADVDAPIRATDTDASLARLSAVRKGYLIDPFISHFVPRALQQQQLQQARPPLINIGTTVRCGSIDALVHSWLSICEQQHKEGQAVAGDTGGDEIEMGGSSRRREKGCQIVSLGAGSDTRFWRLAVSECCPCHSYAH